jgi:hypothetical protein
MTMMMKYSRVDILADTPTGKAIYVEIEPTAEKGATQVTSVMVNERAQRSRVMVTVIVRNAHLSQQTIEQIAHDFVMGKLSLNGGSLIAH